MKVESFKAITRSDVPKADAWIEPILNPVHEQIRDLTRLAQKQVSIGDNMNAEVRDVKARHNVAFDIGLQTLKGKPIGASLIFSDRDEFPEFKSRILDLKKLRCTVKWETDPGKEVLVRVVIWGS